jgi:hypothetical protein
MKSAFAFPFFLLTVLTNTQEKPRPPFDRRDSVGCGEVMLSRSQLATDRHVGDFQNIVNAAKPVKTCCF